MSSPRQLKTVPLDDAAIDHAHREFVQVAADASIADALTAVRQAKPAGRIVYFYAVDAEGRLVGVVPTRRLLLGEPDTPVSQVMVADPVTLPASATVADACEMFFRHRFLALPIVGPGCRLLGVIDVELYADELSDLARREEAEDLFQLIGVRLQEVRSASIPTALARRFPWLLSNIGGGLLCAFLAGLYDDLLQQVVALALYITVTLAIAESVSIQSLTLTLQGHQGLRVGLRDLLRSMGREGITALALGLLCGALVGVTALLWQRDVWLAAVLMASFGMAVTAAGLYGRLVPALLGLLRRDPKVASGPIVLAVTDLTTLTIYFNTATLVLG